MNLKSAFCLSAVICSAFTFAQDPVPKTPLYSIRMPAAIQRSTNLGPLSPSKVIGITVSLPLADPAGLEAFGLDVSDPASPNYQKWITPSEVATRFGISDDKLQSVVNYLTSQGFTIKNVGISHMTIQAQGTVGQAEAAFHTQMNSFRFGAGTKSQLDFYSFTSPIQVPSSIAPYILDIAGMQTFSRRRPMILTPNQARNLYVSAPIYNAGFQGQGRTVGISSWDGFKLSNVTSYYSKYGLPTPGGGVGSNISIITVDGGSQNGTAQAEGDVDIQMVLGMAPLCSLIVYDGGFAGGGNPLIDVLSREQSDNLADVITESYGWILSPTEASAAHQLHAAMTAQGITYMAASGDSGTGTLQVDPFGFPPFDYPTIDGQVLMVGGTVAVTDTLGTRQSEVTWAGGGGGWSTNSAPVNVRPSWQKGNGVPTNINHRLSPDVALMAGFIGPTGAYYFFFDGALTTSIAGTSFASPVFAGQLATAEQRAIFKGGLTQSPGGKRRAGILQPSIYQMNGNPTVWHDIIQGSNGTLPDGSSSFAHAGWDFGTGWGAINWDKMTFASIVKLPLSAAALGVVEGSALPLPPLMTLGQAIQSPDGQYYRIAPVTIPNLGQAASESYQFSVPTTISRSLISELDFSIVDRFATGSTGQLYLFNWTTGKWDMLKSYVIGSGGASTTASLKSNLTTYISAAGQYRVLVRGLQPLSAGVTVNSFDTDYFASGIQYLKS